ADSGSESGEQVEGRDVRGRRDSHREHRPGDCDPLGGRLSRRPFGEVVLCLRVGGWQGGPARRADRPRARGQTGDRGRPQGRRRAHLRTKHRNCGRRAREGAELTHVSERSFHQTAGAGYHAGGDAGHARYFLLSRTGHRPVPGRGIAGADGADAVSRRLAGDGRTRGHQAHRRDAEHHFRREAHRFDHHRGSLRDRGGIPAGYRINDAQQDAQAKINAIRANFPTDMKEPVIQRIDLNAVPIVSIAVESQTADIKVLSSLAEKTLQKRLETVAGVGQVNLIGQARREIQIFLDRDKLKSYGLTYAQVQQAIERENKDLPAGKLEQGRQEPLVRVSGKFRSVEGFDHLIVSFRGGTPIFLPMVARVVDGIEERRSASLIDGRPGLSLDVVKQSGANTVEVADNIEQAIQEINSELPAHIRLRKVVDRSTFIRDSVNDVQVTLVLGGILTVLIVFLFLNSWRSTVITGTALPVSVISTFIIMRVMGFTLNILTLMGLSLAIGLLIDDAIVVRENIVRHMHAGAGHFTAAREATAEIGLAVMATTFTIIAVFVPVAFMGGIIGRFFFQFGITVGFAVLISLYVSFTLDPMLSSRWYDPAADPNVPRSWFGRSLGKINDQVDKLQNVVASVLGWSLSHRWAVAFVAAAAVVSSFWLFGKLGSAFMPSADPGQFQVSYKAAPGISLDRSAEIARELEAEIRRNPAVAYTYTTIGGNAAKPINEGNIFVRRTAIEEADQIGGGEKPIQISVRGAELGPLAPLAEQVMAVTAKIPGAMDVD